MSNGVDNLLAGRAIEELLPQLDSRRGGVLLVGANLPEVAIHVLKNGLFVTVVESDPSRMDAFMGPLKEENVDKSVTWDRRPYSGIEFLSSSYNYIVAWQAPPEGMAMSLFFKKARRELKAGGTLYLRIPVRPNFASEDSMLSRISVRLPAALSRALSTAGRKLLGQMNLDGSVETAEVEEAAARFLNLESVLPLSVVAERLQLLPAPLAALLRIAPKSTLAILNAVDGKLVSWKRTGLLASSNLYRFAKTKEFGRVFKIGWDTEH